jgi:hypothetical protein
MGIARILFLADTHLEFETEGHEAGRLKQWTFHELYARPMIQLELHAVEMNSTELESWIRNSVEKLPEDSVVKLKVHGKLAEETLKLLSAPSLRALAPQKMNINTTFSDYSFYSAIRLSR